MKPLLIALSLLPIVSGCQADVTECKESSEEWMRVQCEKEPGGSACPEHENFNENIMVLIYNCQSHS